MRRRLALLALATTTMVVLAFCVPLGIVVKLVAEDRAVHAGQLEARSLAAVLGGGTDAAAVERALAQLNAGSPRPASLFLPDGRIVGDQTPAGAELAAAREGESLTAGVPGGRAVLVPVIQGSGGAPVVVRVLIPTSQLERGVRRAWLLLALVALTLVAMATALADRLGRSVVGPMERLRVTAQRLSEGQRDARATPEGPPEVLVVAAELNRLADRIDAMLHAEREAAADLSHRLRTPVTALRLDVEALAGGAERERLLGEVDALQLAIDDVIRATRSSAPSRRVAVDLAVATRTRVAFWSVLAEHQHRPVQLALPDGPVPVEVDADELDAAIDALVGNVFAHTPEGTPFGVTVIAGGGAARLRVHDEGPGFAERSLVARGESGAGSTGLGLDIARRTAESAGGRLVVQRPPGRGAVVELVLASQRSLDPDDASPPPVE